MRIVQYAWGSQNKLLEAEEVGVSLRRVERKANREHLRSNKAEIVEAKEEHIIKHVKMIAYELL